MSKVLDGIEFEAGYAKHGSKSPYIAIVSAKMFGVDHQFFKVGDFHSSDAAIEAAQEFLEGMAEVPKQWLARFAVPGL